MGQNGERGSVGDAEFPIDAVEVDLHCPLSQPQPVTTFIYRSYRDVGWIIGCRLRWRH